MRHRLLKIGTLLLVAVVMLGGVFGCQRAPDARAPVSTAEGEEALSTDVALEGEGTPASMETVVSAVTTPAGTAVLPTPGGEGELPAGISPTATVVLEPPVVATAEPVATEPPASEPLPTEPAAAGAGDEPVSHTVQAGDTLASIANRYGTTVAAIVAANGLQDPDQIIVGQELKIPTSGGSAGGTTGGTGGCRYRHVVKGGDWVWQLGREYGVDPYAIMRANGLTIQNSSIYPGQVLCIP